MTRSIATRLTFVSGGYLTAMRITAAMIEAARRAKFDHYQRGWLLGEARFVPTPDGVILAMIEAAFPKIPDETAETAKPPAIVTAAKPRRWR